MPELFNLIDLGEKPMPAHVEMEALVIFRARKAADLISLFENQRPMIELGQLIGRGQPSRAGADDNYLLFEVVVGPWNVVN